MIDVNMNGIERTPYIACLVTNQMRGMGVFGMPYLIDSIDLDLLSAFFSAIDIYSEKEIVGITYKQGNAIWFERGKFLSATIITESSNIDGENKNRKKLIELNE
jgi:hypothetical protein